MKKNELRTLVIENIGRANSINNLLTLINVKSGGIISKIKEIIQEESIDISHFDSKKQPAHNKKYNLVVKNCPVCKAIFETKEGHKKEQNYCSKSCSNKDRIVSEETKNKLRDKALGNDRLKKLIIKYGENTICLIKEERLSLKSYSDIKLMIPEMTEDDIKIICNILNLTKSSGTYVTNFFNKSEIESKYLELKSIKKTAQFFKTSVHTLRKYISVDLIIIKVKKFNSSDSVVNWRIRKKIELVAYKGSKCESCGYNKSYSVLQFHHKDPKEKDFTIGGSSYSFERLKKEADKCMLLCSNCHIELHELLRNTNN